MSFNLLETPSVLCLGTKSAFRLPTSKISLFSAVAKLRLSSNLVLKSALINCEPTGGRNRVLNEIFVDFVMRISNQIPSTDFNPKS